MTLIPGLWTFILSSALMLFIWIFSIQYIKQPIGRAFFMLISAALAWSLLYIGELVSTDFAIKFLYARLQYLGITILPLAWLLLASRHTKIAVSPIIWKVLWGVFGVFCIFIFLIPSPNLFWGNVTMLLLPNTTNVSVLDYNYGPLFYFLLVPYTYIVLLSSLIIMIRGLSKGHRFYRKQLYLVIAGTLIPAIINILYVIGITPIPHMNFSTAGMSVSGVLVGYALFRYRFLAISPVARDLIIDTMLDGVIVVDDEMKVLDVNAAAKTLLGTYDIALGRNLCELIPIGIMSNIEVLIKKSQREPELITYRDKVFDVHVSSLVELGGKHCGYLIMFHDVSEREKLHHQVKMNAKLDPLTQILNRKALFEEIESERLRLSHTKGCLSLIMMDIDHFKDVNDTYGHEGGDRAIAKLVEVIDQILGDQHIFGRYGGDEFIVALIDTPFEKTLEIARLIHSRLTSTLVLSSKASFLIQLSLGAVTIGEEGNFPVPSTSDEIVALADSALYAAKEQGRNTVAFVHPKRGKKIDPQVVIEGLI